MCGIGALNEAAKAAGVVVLLGASSVPALSGAAVRHLASGMERIRAVEMAISASNKATAGPSVAAAILGQVGQPIRLWCGQRWIKSFGWQKPRSQSFNCAGTLPIRGRLVGLVDVPDLALLPERLPGHPAISFRAGTELGFQNRALWLASWFVRWGMISTLEPFAPLLRPLQSLTRKLGSNRSAMIVRLFGDRNGCRVERRWTLIADHGDGPEIPTLSVAPVVARILAGKAPAGARDAGEMLTLDDFAGTFSELAIHHQTDEIPMPPSLYAQVMGPHFAALPDAFRAMHDVLRDGGAIGEAEVAGPSNRIGMLVGRVMGFPKPGRHRLHVHFQEADGRETWIRDFSGRCFRSHLSRRGPWLVERFGTLRFAFALPGDDKGLTMVMQRWWIGLLPLPKWLAPRSDAREWSEDGRFHFDVPIDHPILGRLVHYRGWLQPATDQTLARTLLSTEPSPQG